MYFIRKGRVEVILSNILTVPITEGSYFGEKALLSRCKRLASVIALNFCILVKLSRIDIEPLYEEFPELPKNIEDKLGIR